MARQKERMIIKHQPSTIEIFLCIASMPKWAKLLINEEPMKPYIEMLKGLIEKKFYSEKNERLTIKAISTDLKIETGKVVKWLTAIYKDIFELNESKPELFYDNAISVTLFMRHYDDVETFRISLPALPREYEMFRFYFAKAKVGTDYFWVQHVEHSIENDRCEICIWLRGGMVNKYREFLFEKAKFYDSIDFMDAFNMADFEIDNELKKIYKE